MKLAPVLGLLLLPLAAFGRDTAYQALRTIGVERDQALLNRVVEVRGIHGIPQPENWTIVLDDPLARGGVREIEVAGGRVVSERTPVKGYTGVSAAAAMNFQKLNLDSKGAFVVAEQEARKAKIGFDSVDYLLRRDDQTGSPVWVLQLLDPKERQIASLTIAADTGVVTSRNFNLGGPGPALETARSGEEFTEEPSGGRDEHLGHKIDRTFHRVGASLEEFFTGKRTLDRRFEGE